MSRLFLSFSILILFFTSCSIIGGDYYYPRYHNAAFYQSETNLFYLNWGDKLLNLNQTKVITNKGGRTVSFLKVKNTSNNKIGMVEENSVIHGPLTPGVIIHQTQVFTSPSTDNYINVEPPILVYVTESHNDGWCKIIPYVPGTSYSVSNRQPLPTGYIWCGKDGISTKTADTYLLIALQLAVKNYNTQRSIYNSNPNQDNLSKYQETIAQEIKNIQNLSTRNSNADPLILNEMGIFLKSLPKTPSETGGPAPDSGSKSSEQEVL